MDTRSRDNGTYNLDQNRLSLINTSRAMNTGILLLHASVGCALCAEIITVGMSLISVQATLNAHGIAAPVIFFAVSFNYFRKYRHFSPFKTALFFTFFAAAADFFIVVLLINRSLEMFSDMLRFWIPFASIFLSTYLTGLITNTGRNAMA